MHNKFFIKKVKRATKPLFNWQSYIQDAKPSEPNKVEKKTTKINKKKVNDMDTKEKIEMLNQTLDKDANVVKYIKKDNSLIERTKSSKVILTEDNKELLKD